MVTPTCSELCLRSSEVVLAVLRSGKAPVRGGFQLSLAGLSCGLTGEAQTACLEASSPAFRKARARPRSSWTPC